MTMQMCHKWPYVNLGFNDTIGSFVLKKGRVYGFYKSRPSPYSPSPKQETWTIRLTLMDTQSSHSIDLFVLLCICAILTAHSVQVVGSCITS